MPLEGKTALLTGAGSGIGRCLAGELVRKGACLILVDRDRAALEETISLFGLQDSVLGLVVKDFLELNAVDEVVQEAFQFSRQIDILYNNAGMMAMGQVINLTWEDFERMQAVNLNAPMKLTHRLLPGMIRNGGGYVCFTSSAAAVTTPPGAAGYGMTKAGIAAFSEALRAEVYRHNISVTTICPGFVHTPLARNTKYRDQKCRDRTTSVPKFIGSTPEHVARVSVSSMLRRKGLVVIGWDEKFKWFVKKSNDRLFGLLNRGMAKFLLDEQGSRGQVSKNGDSH